MIMIPLPFVLTVLLLILLVQMLRRREAGHDADMFFIALICAYMLQSVFLGLRWGYGIMAVLPLQILLAGLIAGLAYLSFSALTARALSLRNLWPHSLPVFLVILLLIIRRDLAALAIIVIFLGYGIALLRMARAGPDVLVDARLDGVLRSYRAMQITGYMLIGSVVVDILLNLDFVWNDGHYAAAIIVVTNILTLIVLALAAAVASENQPVDSGTVPLTQTAPALQLAPEQREVIISELDGLMRDQQMFKDMELNLSRIARRLKRPARHVSEAVNRYYGSSVSVYVNNFQIEEACRMLRETDEPVTQIIFASGFMTKSNFNREFLRVTGTSPKAFRSQMGTI